MKRYAVCTIIGTGTEEDMFRPAVSAYPLNWVIAIAPDQQTNVNKKWVLAVLSGDVTTLANADSDPNINVLPLGPESLNNTWLSIGTQAQRNTLVNVLKTITDVTIPRDDPRLFRDVMTDIGLAVDPNFNVANLDVSE